jgi:hypothetical protein
LYAGVRRRRGAGRPCRLAGEGHDKTEDHDYLRLDDDGVADLGNPYMMGDDAHTRVYRRAAVGEIYRGELEPQARRGVDGTVVARRVADPDGHVL